jgi:nitrite reductase (NADH) large subunit
VVVIGGGLLGLEAAWGLARRGMDATVVHLMPTLMERQLDATAGQLLRHDLERRGIRFITGGETEEIFGHDRVEGVRLADGRDIPADLVVMTIGIRPETDLARAAGLDVNRGIVVDDDLRTSDRHIFAVGECAEHRGVCFGLVAPLWDMAEVCAEHLAGRSDAIFATPLLSTRLKITGIDVFSAGALAAEAESDDEVTYLDSAGGVYKKLVLRDGRLVGAVLYGDVADGGWYLTLMQERADVTRVRSHLIFGRASALEPAASPAASPDLAREESLGVGRAVEDEVPARSGLQARPTALRVAHG